MTTEKIQYLDDDIRQIIEEIFRADKSITIFRIKQIAGMENWTVFNVLSVTQKKLF